jgi:hypothetical protein
MRFRPTYTAMSRRSNLSPPPTMRTTPEIARTAASASWIRLHSETVVSLTRDQVWAFFEDVDNLAKWDRSVARVERTTSGPIGVGYQFDTISPSGQRMSYRVSELIPKDRATIDLVNSDMFDRAQMDRHVGVGGRRHTRDDRCRVRAETPVLLSDAALLLNQDNLKTDNDYLHDEMEAYGRAHAP